MVDNAKVYKVTGRKYETILSLSNKLSVDDFHFSFEKMASPEIVLQDNVSLYMLTLKEAVYVDCGSIDVFDKRFPFDYDAQYQSAEKLIVIPIESFHAVSKTLSFPKIPMVNLPHIGRCGSTLLCKVFSSFSGSLSVCEMKSFFDIAKMSSAGDLSGTEIKKFYKNAFLNMVKHANLRGSTFVFVKHHSTCSFYTDLMMEVFPQMKYVFMYRQPIPFVESSEKIFGKNHFADFTPEICHVFCGFGRHNIMKDFPKYSVEDLRPLSTFSMIGLKWMSCIATYNALVQRGYSIKSLKYEDFLENPKQIIESLLSYAGISVNEDFNFDEILSKDAQEGTLVSTRAVPKDELKEFLKSLTKDIHTEVDELCSEFGVPNFWSTVKLPNPIC